MRAIFVGLCLLLTACSKEPESQPAPVPEKGEGVQRYGEPLSETTPKAVLKDVLAKPSAYEGQTVTVSGHVRRACSRKGCWMELAEGDEEDLAGCRVTFKDYGFFVPTDSAGAQATVEGSVEIKRVPPHHVEHMESEGATFAEKNDDGTANEVRLLATGVELQR